QCALQGGGSSDGGDGSRDGTLTISSAVVTGGTQVTVSVTPHGGSDVSFTAVSLSWAATNVLVDGQPVTAQPGSTGAFNGWSPPPSPNSSVLVSLPQDHSAHTIVFTILPSFQLPLKGDCVQSSG